MTGLDNLFCTYIKTSFEPEQLVRVPGPRLVSKHPESTTSKTNLETVHIVATKGARWSQLLTDNAPEMHNKSVQIKHIARACHPAALFRRLLRRIFYAGGMPPHARLSNWTSSGPDLDCAASKTKHAKPSKMFGSSPLGFKPGH